MTSTWIFQANPKNYDLDAALQALDRIWWRVPQHTADVRVGDVVVLWRSGKEAGIIGIGRVAEPPQQHEMVAVEMAFVKAGSEDLQDTTRALVLVCPAPFVEKDRVRAIPELAEHQIITAPMGTVFALSADEWSALAPHLPEPPAVDAIAAGGLPPVFAWEQRAKGVMPMLGGYGEYLTSTRRVCELVAEARPTLSELADRIAAEFGLSTTAARLRTTFLRKMGLIVEDAGVFHVTEWAQTWLDSNDPGLIIGLLHSRCRFIGEMLAELQVPMSTEELLSVVNGRYGLEWDSYTQINNRRGWLQSAGLISQDADKRLVVTTDGRSLLERLDVYLPGGSLEPSTPALPVPVVEPDQPELRITAEERAEAPTEVESLVTELIEAAIESKDPDRFERAVRDAFAFLGFDAEWLGRSGRTDVLLDAHLGRGESYRVAVDAKTTGSGQVGDQQVDWVTLDEHRAKHDADYSMLVGPNPAAGRLMERAETYKVAVLSAKQLAGLCRQHAWSPLGLADYRSLFETGGEVDTAELDEHAEQAAGLVRLAVAVCERMERRSGTVGRLTARDLWLMLADELVGESSDQAEIQAVLDTLASPLIRAVDGDPEQGYRLASPPEVARMRLRLLGDALVAGPASEESE